MADVDGKDASAAVQSREELEANLSEYQSQLEQVDALLSSEPDNAEYAELKSGLVEVISLTKDLLSEAVAAEGERGGVGETTAAAATEAQPPQPRKRKSRWEQVDGPADDAAAAPTSEATTAGADSSSATTTTTAAAMPKLAPPPPSAPCPVAAAPDADDDDAQPPARYHAPGLPKRRGAEAPSSEADAAAIASEEMPKWLEIKPGDDEKEVERKKKKQKAWKAKRRLAERDLEARRKQASWQAFSANGGGGVGKKKKKVDGGGGGTSNTGSIYSVPRDDPLRRVGVVAAPKRTE